MNDDEGSEFLAFFLVLGPGTSFIGSELSTGVDFCRCFHYRVDQTFFVLLFAAAVPTITAA